MAIAIDKPDIGHNSNGTGNTTTLVVTTNQTVAANAFIVMGIGWFLETTTLSTVTGGGLTWTIDKQGVNPSGSSQSIAIASAQAPSGLASGTALTLTFSGNTQAITAGATSFTGVAASSPLDGAPPAIVNSTSTSWTSPSTTISAGSVLVGVSWNEGATSQTVTSPSIEAVDYADPNTYAVTLCYRIESSGGAYTVAGAWNSGTVNLSASAAYLAAAGGAAAPGPVRAFTPLPFMKGPA